MIERARIEPLLGRIESLFRADGSDVEIIDVREDRVMMRDGSVVTRFTLLTVSSTGRKPGSSNQATHRARIDP